MCYNVPFTMKIWCEVTIKKDYTLCSPDRTFIKNVHLHKLISGVKKMSRKAEIIFTTDVINVVIT